MYCTWLILFSTKLQPEWMRRGVSQCRKVIDYLIPGTVFRYEDTMQQQQQHYQHIPARAATAAGIAAAATAAS
jgi:hypothetical protein